MGTISTQASFFRRFAENSTTAMAEVDTGGRILFANGAFRRLFVDAEQNLSSLPKGLGDVVQSAVRDALRGGKEQAFSCRMSEGNDEQACRGRVLPADTEGVFFVEVQEDAAALQEQLAEANRARQAAELKGERGRRLFFDVIEELPVFVYMQRRDYTVAYANKKTKNFYGETDGRRCYEVFGERDSPCSLCPTFGVFDTGIPVDWQFTDGKGRTFHIYDYPFEDENGEPLVLELGIDVTELKRAEDALLQAYKMRAIGVLAGGIAHDLNNNLVPIIFNLEYALGKITDDIVAEPLREALRAAYRAAELVEQVLEYSRQQNFSREPLHLIPLAQENLDVLQASLPDNIQLQTHFSAQKDCISANTAQIQQILLNLCRNAVHAMPGGGDLSVSVDHVLVESPAKAPHAGLTQGSYVVLQVKDTGRGIAPENIERIFEPFYTSKKQCGGTGMGLAVVHAIVSGCGGHIYVDSALGEGSTFTLYFPTTTPVKKKTLEERSVVQWEHGRLLVVDDDKDALQAMQRVLRDAGFEVLAVGTAVEGLETYFGDKQGFDIVLADHSMPGMSGMDMSREILERDTAAKIIICTGHVEPALERQAEEAGITSFLMKPMTPRTLVETVRRHCR